MVKMSATDAADKWKRKTKGAVDDMRKGIARVSEAPGVKAAEKQEKMKQNLNKAIDDGTWARRTAGVPLNEWKQKALEKGIPRVAQGVESATGKMEKFMGEFLPHVEAGQQKIANMPDLTLEDGIARASEMIRHNAKFKKS